MLPSSPAPAPLLPNFAGGINDGKQHYALPTSFTHSIKTSTMKTIVSTLCLLLALPGISHAQDPVIDLVAKGGPIIYTPTELHVDSAEVYQRIRNYGEYMARHHADTACCIAQSWLIHKESIQGAWKHGAQNLRLALTIKYNDRDRDDPVLAMVVMPVDGKGQADMNNAYNLIMPCPASCDDATNLQDAFNDGLSSMLGDCEGNQSYKCSEHRCSCE